jgi:hypothetical protein
MFKFGLPGTFYLMVMCSLVRAGEFQFGLPSWSHSKKFTMTSLAVSPSSDSQNPRKSPWIAASLSAMIPGTGELYAKAGHESLIKSIGFLTAEVSALVVYFHYRNKGNSYEKKYERYADRHWDVDKYLFFLERSLNLQEGYLGRKDTGIEKGRLELAEDEWGSLSGVSVHHLYKNTRQQYYEMIYKYPEQFALGWSDTEYDYNNPIPNYQTGYTRNSLTPMMVDYRSMRVKSNDYLSTARGVTGIIMINHLLSMADAAWTVKKKNAREDNKMSLALRLEQKMHFNSMLTMPTLRLTY